MLKNEETSWAKWLKETGSKKYFSAIILSFNFPQFWVLNSVNGLQELVC